MLAEGSLKRDEVAMAVGGQAAHVLVVDDDAQLAELYQLVLEGAGFTVTVAGDGAQALQRYREAIERHHPFSLVMLDLNMPVMDGRQTLEVLQTMDARARVLLTTGVDEGDLGGLEKRVQGVVSKPTGIRDLLRSVRSVLAS